MAGPSQDADDYIPAKIVRSASISISVKAQKVLARFYDALSKVDTPVDMYG